MPTKALSCKKEAICEHGPEAPFCPVGQVSFKMDCFKVGKFSMFRVQDNQGCCVLQAKEEGDLPACHQRLVQKPASLMVWGCISADGMGMTVWAFIVPSNVLEGAMNSETCIKV